MEVPPHIIVDEAHGIIVCAVHRYALLPMNVLKHFTAEHRKDTTPLERRAIEAAVETIAKTIDLKTDYSDFEPPETVIPPIAGLKIHEGSYQCHHCGFIISGNSAVANMKTHLRRKHNHFAPPAGESDDWFQSVTSLVCSQRFFTSLPAHVDSRLASHFKINTIRTTVDNDCAPPRYGHPTTPPAIDTTHPTHNTVQDSTETRGGTSVDSDNGDSDLAGDLMAQLESAENWAETERVQRMAMIPPAPDVSTSPWVAHTKFHAALQGLSWAEALHYVAIPRAIGEGELFMLYRTVKSMVRTWQNVVVASSRFSRIRVMQEDRMDVPVRPLEPYQFFNLKHAGILQKVFIFFYRVLSTGLTTPSTLAINSQQQQNWTKIQEYLQSNTCDGSAVQENHTRTTLNPLESLCHQFWLSLVEQTSRGGDEDLALITPLVYIALSPTGSGFQPAYLFATSLSAMKKFARMSGLQKLRDEIAVQSIPQVEAPQSNSGYESLSDDSSVVSEPALTGEEAAILFAEQEGSTLVSTEQSNRNAADMFKDWVYNYLTTEYPTPMFWIVSTARLLSRYQYGEGLDAFVSWQGDTVSVRGVRTTLFKYQNMVWNEYETASRLLCQLAFTQSRSNLPAIPWSELYEEPSNQTPGFTLFSSQTPALAKGKGFIGKQLMKAVPKRQYKETLITDMRDSTQVLRWCTVLEEFLQHLLLLVHCVGGGATRGTEATSVYIENTGEGDLRNIFLYNGLVAIVPRYHKGYNQDKSVKSIYRFLPREIGSLLVWYVWLVRPFYTLILHQVAPHILDLYYPQATSSLLWPGKDGKQRRTSHLLSQVLRQASTKWMGVEINMSTFRHLIIAFSRKIDSLNELPEELSKADVDEIYDEVEAEAREMQSGHSPETAHAIYALDIQRLFGNRRFDRPVAHFKTSTKWHKALNFEPVDDQDSPPKTVLYPSRQQLEDRMGANYTKLLRVSLGAAAVFRGQQESALRAVMQGSAVVTYIAGTGTGKSLLFLLPSCFPGYRKSVVIVPLAALRTDLLARCSALSIRTSIWTQGHCDETATIILATPESMSNEGFIAMVHRLRTSNQLERIVVDEFHYVILPDKRYRPHLENLQTLAQYGTPLTLLSATIPFQEQAKAFRIMGLSGDTVPFREATTRPNIRYQVERPCMHKPVTAQALASHIRGLVKKFQKIIVYFDFASTVNEVAQILGCRKFHGRMTDGEKSASQASFGEDETGAMVASSAFREGVHYPDVNAVFRFSRPEHLIGWLQEGGRAGRRGQASVAGLILVDGFPDSHFDKADHDAKRLVEALIHPTRMGMICRRQVIDWYMDGNKERKMCLSREEKCDLCMATFYSHPSSPTAAVFTGFSKDHISYPPQGVPGHEDENQSNFVTPTTPIRTPARPAQPSTPTLQSYSAPMSSPYAVSASKDDHLSFPSQVASVVGTPQLSGSLPFSPKKRTRAMATLPSPTQSSSPSKRLHVPLKALQSSPPSTATDLDYMSARNHRQLSFNEAALGDANAQRVSLFTEQLPATQQYWIDNCVACFTLHTEFNHPRASCSEKVGEMVRDYRVKLKHEWGRGQCWRCLMPFNCCPKYAIPGTNGRAQTTSIPGKDCVSCFAIRDTWACVWERCTMFRAKWIERIRATEGQDWTDEEPGKFARYWQKVTSYGNDHKVGQICLDVNWFTHTYFIGHDQPGSELW